MKSMLLFSGGMDSIALAAWKRPDCLLTINYGQRPFTGEYRAAKAAADALDLRHELLEVSTASVGSGDLAGTSPADIAPASDWWPFRNQLLITLAAARAVSATGMAELLIATVRSDDVHADGRKSFVDAMDALLSVQEGGLRLRAPALELSTADLVRQSKIDLSILAWAHSCHVAEWACGACRGCNKHRETWRELGHEPY